MQDHDPFNSVPKQCSGATEYHCLPKSKHCSGGKNTFFNSSVGQNWAWTMSKGRPPCSTSCSIMLHLCYSTVLTKWPFFSVFQFCFIFNLILNTLCQTAKQAWAGQAAWAVRASVPILVLVFITKVAQVSEPSEPTNEASSEPPGIMIPESGTVRN